MNPLMLSGFAGLAGVGLMIWQQTSIDQVNAEITRLTRGMVELRDASEADRAEILAGRSRLRQMRGTLRQLNEDQAAVDAERAAAFTPEKEGWWPENRSYCYLPKSSLPFVKFGLTDLTPEEADALWKRKLAAAGTTGLSVSSAGRSPAGDYSYEFRLFDEVGMTPEAAALLGMGDTEKHAAWDAYKGLFKSVQALETARAIRVDPPQPASADKPDHQVVARIPDLTAERQPLIDALERDLSATLGTNRVGILSGMVRDYAESRLDQMGMVPREFVRIGTQLQVKVGRSYKWEPLTLGGRQTGHGTPLEYGHLFGPGAPCELK